MIEVDSLLYKIDLKLNKLSTNDHQEIPVENKILALNEAQIKLIKQKMDGISIPSGLGFDSMKKRYEDLQKLVHGYVPLDLSLKDKRLNKYSAKISDLSPEYMFYANCYFLANKGRCKDRIIWINSDLAKHGDVQILLNNDHYKPSFEYQESFNLLSSDEISIFTDGTFTPTKLYLSYIRYPQKIDKEGYEGFDGEASTNSNCELAAYLEDELVDLTVQNLAMYTENAPAVQSSQFRIQTNE